jgi:hypothetical protein
MSLVFEFDQVKADQITGDEAARLLGALRWPGEDPWLQTFADGPDALYSEDAWTDKNGQPRMTRKFCVKNLPATAGQGKRRVAAVDQYGSHPLADLTSQRPYWVQNSSARVGAYFCVNTIDPEAKRRSNDTVRRVAAVFLDLDGKPLPVDGFPLPPTATVESSPGRWHVYWAVSDLPLSEFTAVQKHLARLYGGDEKVSDLARVMRLPGYWHGKADEGFLSRLVELYPDAQYTRADLLGELISGFPGLREALDVAARETAERLQRAAESQARAVALRAELSSGRVTDRTEVLQKYGQAALFDEVGKLSSTRQGGRNDQLFKSAAALGECVAAGVLEQGNVEAELRAAALAIGLSEHETETTLNSGLTKGQKSPRDLSKVGQLVGKKKAMKVDGSSPAASRGDSEVKKGGLPEIEVGGRQLRDIADDSVSALLAANEPPAMFRRAGELVRLVDDEGVRIKLFDHIGLKGELARCADFVKTVEGKEGPETSPARPPADLAPDLLARVDRLPFPPLRLLATTPVYSAAGELVSSEGYHPDSGIFLSMQGLQVPELPSPVDGLALLREMLCDFPFTHESGLAHTLSAILLPFLRRMIDGPTPLILVEASTRGTGKGLLCEVVPLVALGADAGVMVQPRDGDEFEKRVTSMLLEGSRVILLDNVHTLKGEALAAALTARTWRGRRLGKSEMLTLQNDALWMATGNNVVLDDDMPRRIIPIRLDAGVERPENRTGFRHPKLLTWIRENRPALVAACISLVESWKAAGRPEGSARLGSYESWSAVLGGVLDVAGVPGFLQGREHLYEESNPEPGEWGEVLEAVYAVHGSKPQHARMFLSAMQGLGTHVDLWEGHKSLSQMQRVGRALLANRDRVFKGRRIRAAGIDASTKSKVYRVEMIPEVPGLLGAITPETPGKPREKEAVQEDVPGVSGVYGVSFLPTYAKNISPIRIDGEDVAVL